MPGIQLPDEGEAPSHMSFGRRTFLRVAALSGAGAAFGSLLAACGGGGTISNAPSTTTSSSSGVTSSTTTSSSSSGSTSTKASPAAGASPASATGSTGSSGKTLTIAVAADPKGLDPERVLDNTAGFVMSAIYDRIVHYKEGSTETVPGLSEKWDISPDGKTYTFHLRKGVKFHDGSDFNGAAWVSELDRILKKDDPNYIFKETGVQSFAEDTYGLITSYKATDDATVEVQLKEAFAPFLTNLAMVWSGVPSQKAIKSGQNMQEKPVGTGPFSFVEWARNDHVTLKANPNYWGDKPKVDGVIYRVVPESSVRVLKLKNNEIQIIADMTTDDVLALKDAQGIKLVQQPGLTINGVSMASDKPPFDNPKVRQAMNYAVNKEEMNKALYSGLGQVANAPVPPTDWSYDKSLQAYPFDVNKAKQLLNEAGFKGGTEVSLMAYQNPRGYNPAGGKMAVAIQQYLGDVGVNVKIETLDFGAFLDKRRSFNWEGMAMAGWSGDNGDPDNFLYSLYGGPSIPINNSSRWKSDDVDNLLIQAREESDHNKRVQLYQQAEKLIWDAAPWIWINYTTQTRAIRDTVQGFTLNPTQMFFNLEHVSLS